MSEPYRVVVITDLSEDRPFDDEQSRSVVHWRSEDGSSQAVQFRCPCGDRLPYVVSPPHGIRIAEDGKLTIEGSVGSRENFRNKHPRNWCHFFIRDGQPEMCSDAKCPGKDL